MKLITKRDEIKAVLSKFRMLHKTSLQEPSWVEGKTKGELLKELKALDLDTASEGDVYAVLERNWTALNCSECGKDSEAVMQLGEEPDYESATAWVCLHCLEAAVNRLREV